jgi:hypothetical protein
MTNPKDTTVPVAKRISALSDQQRTAIDYAIDLRRLEERATHTLRALETKRKQAEAGLAAAGIEQPYKSLLGKERHKLGWPFGDVSLPV